MILADKIIKLRKQLGWSQEDLAEKMDVSRQSVSKWESTNSIPDLNKIIKLAGIFDVTTDFLLKDDMDTEQYLGETREPGLTQVNLEQALVYVDTKLAGANLVAKGVALCVCSAAPLFFLLALSNTRQLELSSDVIAAFGIVSLLLMVSVGISLFIKTNQFNRSVAKMHSGRFELYFGVHSAVSAKMEQFTQVYHKRLTLGISLFIFSSLPLMLVVILSGRTDMTLLMLVVLLLMVAAGIYVIIPVSAQSNAYHLILNEGDIDAGKSRSTKNAEKLAAFYWPLLVAVYLAWSFFTMDWHITWIMWPVGAVTFAALVGLMDLLAKEKAH